MPKTQDLSDFPHSVPIHGPCSKSTAEASNISFILICFSKLRVGRAGRLSNLFSPGLQISKQMASKRPNLKKKFENH